MILGGFPNGLVGLRVELGYEDPVLKILEKFRPVLSIRQIDGNCGAKGPYCNVIDSRYDMLVVVDTNKSMTMLGDIVTGIRNMFGRGYEPKERLGRIAEAMRKWPGVRYSEAIGTSNLPYI